MSVDPRLLTEIPLFKDLAQDALDLICSRGRTRTFKTEEAILHQDDPGETLYVIVRGIVKVSTTEPDGAEVFLAVLASGDNFGELSLIDSKFRSADVVTQEETALICIDRATFEELMANGSFARNMLRILANRNRRANERIRAHCTLDVYGLVARQILEFSQLYGKSQPDGSILIPIRLTQSDIGDLVGASRERVNQVMKFFREKHSLSIDPSYHITVHKPADLQAASAR
jgi:CRP/FNR family cyclic AMP-dependent transcriptional regulator